MAQVTSNDEKELNIKNLVGLSFEVTNLIFLILNNNDDIYDYIQSIWSGLLPALCVNIQERPGGHCHQHLLADQHRSVHNRHFLKHWSCGASSWYSAPDYWGTSSGVESGISQSWKTLTTGRVTMYVYCNIWGKSGQTYPWGQKK